MAINNHYSALPTEVSNALNEYINSSVFAKEENILSLIASLYCRLDSADDNIKRCLERLMVNIESIFNEKQISILLKEYYAFVRAGFDDILNNVPTFKNNRTRMPRPIMEFCKAAVDVKPGDSVFFPNGGSYEFAYYLRDCKCFGRESLGEEWALSQIFMQAYQIESDIECTSEPYPVFDKKASKKYDYIFTELPMVPTSNNGGIIKSVKSILANCLKDGGTMCIIAPALISESLNWKGLREFFAQESGTYSLAVIALPHSFLGASAVNTQVWIITKQSQIKGKVLFVNAKDDSLYIVDKQTKELILKTESIIESIKKYDTRYSRLVSFEETGISYRFNPERYFIESGLPELKPDERYIQLGDLIELMPPTPMPAGITRGKIIGMRELSDNYLTPEIEASKLPEGTISGLIPVSYEGILLGFIGNRFKVGVIANMMPEDNIYIRREIVRFNIRSSAPIKKEYLLRELLSDYVRKQAINMATGVTITRISKDDLCSIKIIVPPLEKQEEAVFADGLAGMSAADRERIQYFEKLRKNMHMMKHGLGQTVFNLSNWVQILNVAREAGHGIINDNAEIGGLVKVKVSEVFDNIETAISLLSKQISTFDVGYGMKSSVSSIPLVDFIDDYINNHPYPNVRYDFASQQYRATDDLPVVDVDEDNNNSIKATIRKDEFIFRKGDAVNYIEFNKDALTIIFDNIISNAVSHGFVNPKKEHIIHIEFTNEGSSCVLSISNNGEPLAIGNNPDDLFVWGNTTGGNGHAGIGGYQIRDLMEDFGGTAEIISTPNEEFTVTYKLTFTKTNISTVEL